MNHPKNEKKLWEKHGRRILLKKILRIFHSGVTIQSRVASRHEWRTGAKAKRCPGLGARPVRLES